MRNLTRSFRRELPNAKTLSQRVSSILRKYGTDAHVYLPGIGVINGLTAGNYLDSAGTTPATVDNPVGLVLDSANGDLGSELVINGSFDTDTDWVKGTGWTISGGKVNALSSSSDLYQVRGYPVGFYLVEFTVSNYSAGTVRVAIGGVGVLSGIAANGTYRCYVKTSTSDFLYIVGTSFSGSVDVISVKSVSGIHATQATTANKPILRRGAVNLLLNSERFNDTGLTGWINENVTVTENAETAPNGTLTAELLESTTSATWARTYNNSSNRPTIQANTNFTCSVYLKSDVAFTGSIRVRVSGTQVLLSNINITTNWQRFSVTTSHTTTGFAEFMVHLNENGISGVSVTGRKLYIWGAQLQTGSVATDYVATTTAAASSPTGNYWWQFADSTDVLTATFPAGYESATIINTAETGQVTYTAQNIVGSYDIRGAVIGSELVDTANSASAWVAYGTNTVVQEGDAVKITYVDNSGGAYLTLNGANGLSQDVVVGKNYLVSFRAKVSSGASVNINLNATSSGTIATTITATDYVPVYLYVTFTGTSPLMWQGASMGTGEIIWIKNISVKEATPKEYARFIFRTGLTAGELTTMQTFANRLAGV